MKKKLTFSWILLSLFLLSGCFGPKPLYYWGNYQSTYYKNMKKADDKAYDNHVLSLLTIIDKSKEKGLKVPPGVYAELGHVRLSEGDNVEAKKYFELELATYPESIQTMKLYIDKL